MYFFRQWCSYDSCELSWLMWGEWVCEWHGIQVILWILFPANLTASTEESAAGTVCSSFSEQCLMCVMQVITLKLIVMMSLNIRVMTSHDCTCVQCVRNGLQGKADWEIIYSHTVEKSCIHVLSVRNDSYLVSYLVWPHGGPISMRPRALRTMQDP